MKCEDCGKETEVIVHNNGKDRCFKCDDKYEIEEIKYRFRHGQITEREMVDLIHAQRDI